MKIGKKLLVVVLLLFPLKIRALSLLTSKDINCTITNEYKEFLKLSKEEQKKTLVPIMCEEFKNNIRYSVATNNDVSTIRKFDLRNVDGKNYITSVKNQLYTNTCWAHSLANSIESNYLRTTGKEVNISELALGYTSSFQLKDGINPFGVSMFDSDSNTVVPLDTISAGNSLTGIVSLVGSGRGFFSEDKIGLVINNESIVDSSNGLLKYINMKSEFKIDNLYISNSTSCQDNNNKEIDVIKNMLFSYGPVDARTYYEVDEDGIIGFTADFKNYYYLGDGKPNHAISIVGWDDDYSKDNFKEYNGSKPIGNGAFIVKNSYGVNFGDKGYYYISYYDKNICILNSSVDGVDEVKSDYNSYFYDLSSFPTTLSQKSLYLANKFIKNDKNVELLNSIKLLGMEKDDEYELYYSKDLSSNNYRLLSKGKFKTTGLSTINVDSSIMVDDEFYIILKYSSNSGVPIGIFATEYSDPLIATLAPIYSTPKLGVSYYSLDTKNWADSVNDGLLLCVNQVNCDEESDNVLINFNPYIYVFTTIKSYQFSIKDINKNSINNIDGGIIKYSLNLENVDVSKINVKILNSKNENVTDKFIINYDNDSNEYFIKVLANNDLVDNYNIIFSYDNIELTDQFSILKKQLAIESIKIVGEDSVYANGKLILNVDINPLITGVKIEWQSSDVNVATVEDGVVNGISEGETIITARLVDNNNISASKKIYVKGVKNSGIVSELPENNNSKEGLNNPKTGIDSYLLIVSLILFTSFGMYIYIKNKKLFYKF